MNHHSRDPLAGWIDEALATIPLRTNSLIVTLFGDAIALRGGAIWLGNLIELMAPLGINARAVRTGVFRLTQEDWLNATPVGRRSIYSLTASGRRRVHHAHRRIHEAPQEEWNGEWQIVFVPEGALQPGLRDELRHDLLWQGYGAIAPGVFACPATSAGALRELLQQTGCANAVVTFRASALDGTVSRPLQALVHECWHLDRLATDYRRFYERFAPTLEWLAAGRSNEPQQCFALRILLIHEFRRILLRDPQLPDSLLAGDWPGHAARALCREIYRLALPLSDIHLERTLQTPTSRPPGNTSTKRKRPSTDEEEARKL
jgi:phenylacetic acid degradation operon negative regulatory protein